MNGTTLKVSRPTRTPDGSDCPSDYPELFQKYWGLACSRVARHGGIPRDEIEDVAMSILTRFIERDFLKEYAPVKDYRDKKTGEPRVRKQTFVSFFMVFFDTYVYSYVQRSQKLRSREFFVLDSPDPGISEHLQFLTATDGGLEAAIAWGDLSEVFQEVISSLEKTHPTYLELFRQVAVQAVLDGRIYPKVLRESTGLSASQVTQGLTVIRSLAQKSLEGRREV